MRVYQLQASGSMACFSGQNVIVNRAVFTSHEAAERRIPAFEAAVFSNGLLMLDRAMARVVVIELTICDDTGSEWGNLP